MVNIVFIIIPLFEFFVSLKSHIENTSTPWVYMTLLAALMYGAGYMASPIRDDVTGLGTVVIVACYAISHLRLHTSNIAHAIVVFSYTLKIVCTIIAAFIVVSHSVSASFVLVIAVCVELFEVLLVIFRVDRNTTDV